jgi:hypothetical protein
VQEEQLMSDLAARDAGNIGGEVESGAELATRTANEERKREAAEERARREAIKRERCVTSTISGT